LTKYLNNTNYRYVGTILQFNPARISLTALMVVLNESFPFSAINSYIILKLNKMKLK